MCQPYWNAISGIMMSYPCLYYMVFLVPGVSSIIMTVNPLVSAGFLWHVYGSRSCRNCYLSDIFNCVL